MLQLWIKLLLLCWTWRVLHSHQIGAPGVQKSQEHCLENGLTEQNDGLAINEEEGIDVTAKKPLIKGSSQLDPLKQQLVTSKAPGPSPTTSN
ncbi:hypothetical protein OIU84_018955 [Salix udensis]|uniref:Uncharacterized protein n=1 Tax=Salix udensis TaxID=889485 RepID=A0AAD6KXQ2_9ROSI|nr:hypothetical protein OIU84_018955 [Salix udensis]